MTCRTPDIRAQTLERRLRDRVDNGSGQPHRPWIETRDISSKGFQTRMYCVKSGRALHLHSRSELAAALEAWWDRDVVEIEEQKALQTRKTCRAAATLDLPHPVYKRLRRPAVLSTDLLAVYYRNGRYSYDARAVKHAKMRLSERAQRLLMIEQETWRHEGVPWTLVKADGMNARRSQNLLWLQQCENNMHAFPVSNEEMQAQENLLKRLQSRSDRSVIDACRFVEQEHGYALGTAARAFRQLLTLRKISVDLNAKNPIFEPLSSVDFGS